MASTRKLADRNTEKAIQRGKITEDNRVADDDNDTAADSSEHVSSWLRLQKGNPLANPWMSPQFLTDTWCLASEDDVRIPLLPAIPDTSEIRRLREACGLKVEQVAEKAQVSADQWQAFEYGDETVRRHINELQLLRFASAMALCVAAGGPPVPAPAEPVPERPPMKVVGIELLEDLRREIGDRLPLSQVILDNHLSAKVANGELPSPTLVDYPSEREAARLVTAFQGLANRRRGVVWTNSSHLAELVERTDLTDAPYIARDELDVGRGGMLRLWGTMAAIVQQDPGRVAAIDAVRADAEQRRQDQEATAAQARAAVAQASLLLAQAEASKANEALTKVGA